MKTKLCYVLTSSEKDIYTEQAWVSMYSAKYHNPDIAIVLIMDDKTAKTLTGARAELLQYVDEKVIVALDDKYSMKQKSRLLKTSVREHIKGDFLYIDVDTVVCGSLSGLDELDMDVGAVNDAHFTLPNHPLYSVIKNMTDKIGLDVSNEKNYFNGGVIYQKDTPQAHKLMRKWYENYIWSMSKGMDSDMPALLLSDRQMGYIIKQIPDIYNVQIACSYVFGMRIMHYYSTGMEHRGKSATFLSDVGLYREIKRSGEIPNRAIYYIQNPDKIFDVVDMYEHTGFFYRRAPQILWLWYDTGSGLARFQYMLVEFIIRAINKIEKTVGLIKV